MIYTFIHFCRDVVENTKEEYTKRTKLTFLTESGHFNSSSNKPGGNTTSRTNNNDTSSAVETDDMRRFQRLSVRPHTVSEFRIEPIEEAKTECSDLPVLNKNGVLRSSTACSHLRVGIFATNDDQQREKQERSTHSRKTHSRLSTKTPEPPIWSGLRDAIYANDEPPKTAPSVYQSLASYDEAGNTSTQTPWMDQFLNCRKRVVIETALNNSKSKGLRKLASRSGRRRKNPWKGREKEIWENRHNARVIHKPEPNQIELTEEEKQYNVKVSTQETRFYSRVINLKPPLQIYDKLFNQYKGWKFILKYVSRTFSSEFVRNYF